MKQDTAWTRIPEQIPEQIPEHNLRIHGIFQSVVDGIFQSDMGGTFGPLLSSEIGQFDRISSFILEKLYSISICCTRLKRAD